MANPYDVQYVVTRADVGGLEGGSLTWNGKCYAEGDTIAVDHLDILCFMGEIKPEAPLDNCFPEYCLTADGYPTKGYRVPVLVPANGVVEIHTVPSIDGCAAAGMVCFHYCSPCLYVGYDADPIIDPMDPDGQTGGGADPNPTCRDLIENGVAVETIHMSNPTDADVLVMLSYYR